MRVLKKTVSKDDVSKMPMAAFQGRIVVVDTEENAGKAVDALKGFPVVGIDTETRPSFKKGRLNKVALLQVAAGDSCFLFRLNRCGMAPSLVDFLENPQTVKVGLSLRDDFRALHHRADFEPQGYVELQDYVKDFGIQDNSLQKIYANLFGCRISKSQRLSNWEAEELTEAQQVYAATDAWACLRIYALLHELHASNDYVLEDDNVNREEE